MIEPPQPGFTGVVWPARPPDKLARDLTTGPGSVPMAEAVQAWTQLAASFGAAVVDYEKAVTELRTAWGSGRSNEVLERISTLREWLVEAATAAAANAARFQAQVTAYEVARLAMPNSGDLAQIQQIQKTLESLAGMFGAPIKGVAADTDQEADVAKAIASRVMENYEKATEPLAQPWQHAEPPVIAPDTALAAERAVDRSAPAATATPGALPIGPSSFGVLGIPFTSLPVTAAPRVPVAYEAPVYTQSATTSGATSQAARTVTGGSSSQAVPYAPGATGAAAGGSSEAPRFPRASLPGEEGDHLGAEHELRAAPAVLGGVEPKPGGAEPPAARTDPPTGGQA